MRFQLPLFALVVLLLAGCDSPSCDGASCEDAAPPADAGPLADAGSRDSGTVPDQDASLDAGPNVAVDGGPVDGGSDAGVEPPRSGWLGVPPPAPEFGYDPITIERPAPPSAWPSAEAADHYYIDRGDAACTDSSNPFGYPDRPRCTPEAKTYAAGSRLEIHGEGYTFSGGNQWRPIFEGTAAEPVWIVGDPDDQPIMDGKWTLLNSSHVIVEEIYFRTNGAAIDLREGNHFITLRHLEAHGEGIDSTSGAVFSTSGAETNWNDHVVLYDLDVTDVGNRDPGLEDDVLGVTAGMHVERVWVLDSYIARMGADSIRVGANRARTGGDVTRRARMVFVAGNHFEDNGENSVDLKFCEDVVLSQNQMHGAGSSISDSGAVVVSHEHAERVWLIFNDIYDGFIGVASTDGVRDHMVVGNLIHDVREGGGDSGRGFALNVRGGTTGVFINNSVFSTDSGLQVENGQLTVANNIFAERSTAGVDLAFDDSSALAATTLSHNLFGAFRARQASAVSDSLGVFQTSSGQHVGIEGAPRWTQFPDDLTLMDGSAAIDAGLNQDALCADYESRYGASICFGYDGAMRPLGADWDIGAYER